MATRSILRIGDCFEIPLPYGRRTYCRLVAKNSQLGFLIEVYDALDTSGDLAADQLKHLPLLFPPVFVGLQGTARSGRWRRIGNWPLSQFQFPQFRQTMGTKPGVYSDWRIWDGENAKFIGTLPESMRRLELKCVWGDEGLEERIVAGMYRGDHMT